MAYKNPDMGKTQAHRQTSRISANLHTTSALAPLHTCKRMRHNRYNSNMGPSIQ